MSELTSDKSQHFSKKFFQFRAIYYFNETKELLARHKLLVAFIICLLAPGISNVKAIGIPFFVIINPEITLKLKFINLIALLVFLMMLTTAQGKFIKGGTFRDYLQTFSINPTVHKSIDTIILLLSLNVVWLAILFGGAMIPLIPASNLLLYSYYALYAALIANLITFLLNSLYSRYISMLAITFSLVLIAMISAKQIWQLNLIAFLLTGIISILNFRLIQPHRRKRKRFKNSQQKKFNQLMSGNSLKSTFLLQTATSRANRNTLLLRGGICLLLSFLSYNLFSSQEVDRTGVFVLILVNLEVYILSTFMTFFQKDELNFQLFHRIYPYPLGFKRLIEIITIFGYLLLVTQPLMMFTLIKIPGNTRALMIVLFISLMTIAINRLLYAYSLRFCLFTSLLNMIGNIIMQYILIGATLGN
ncbi:MULTISPECIES: DUF6136 family protein [Legionella]|uniref:Uncharacterized protein n=1 Tax=Legionella drozanskii LLAP-1 TaxID=1212489 RepID=A0A0W0TC56_9GAMM|nr:MULTISPECIES: hypothetical protein [Legionella]KTC93176.1 hypothetical protein Ldro_0547 [Legionella drozanskii LLAP-1]PJE14174.1 MAG: hypothetical protein CK430_05480 [Legionella sp.]